MELDPKPTVTGNKTLIYKWSVIWNPGRMYDTIFWFFFLALLYYERNVFRDSPFFAMQVLHSLLIFFELPSVAAGVRRK